jgi:hypothetical protein
MMLRSFGFRVSSLIYAFVEQWRLLWVLQFLEQKRVICKVTLSSSPWLWACFHPPIPSFSDIHKVRIYLLSLSMKCKKLNIECTRLESNYNSCMVRSNENICRSSQERRDETQFKKLVWLPVISLCKKFHSHLSV